MTGINSQAEHDHLPFVARTGNRLTLVWMRYDTAQALPWLSPKSDLFFSTSLDGLKWASPSKITRESGNVVNIFPALYRDFDDTWSFVWLSTRLGVPGVFELPVADADRYPVGLIQDRVLPEGYSHRIVATTNPGLYFGVWVQGPDGAQDIYARFFKRRA
jgi:hypothetical protein